MKASIYALVDPRSPETVRYVGQTYHPAFRHLQHCRFRSTPRSTKEKWVESLRSHGVFPQMVILEVVEEVDANFTERFWQGKYENLTNDKYSSVQRACYREPGLPVGLRGLRATRAESDRASIVAALAEAHGNMTHAARILHISRPTLYERLTILGIDRKTIRSTTISTPLLAHT